MAENPTLTIARLLGGVVLLNGNLGHQVLGQLLIMNSNEVVLAGAAGVIAATSGQRDAAAQIAIRTAVPALAVRALLLKQEQRIERRLTFVAERERELEKRTQQAEQYNRRLAALEAEKRVASSTITALKTHYDQQLTENTAFRDDAVRKSGLKIDAPQRPSGSTARRKKETPSPRRPRKPKA